MGKLYNIPQYCQYANCTTFWEINFPEVAHPSEICRPQMPTLLEMIPVSAAWQILD